MHPEPVGGLALNSNGMLLASCSINGTNIKIFSTRDCTKLRKLSRGKTSCQICHLSFSLSANLISLTSKDKQTIHVWRCGLEADSTRLLQEEDSQEALDQSQRRVSSLLSRVITRLKGSGSEHMMWSVTPLAADKKGKYCGFSPDE